MSDTLEPPNLDFRASLKKPLQWAFGVALVTAAISLFMPNWYRSEASILPVESKGASSLGNLAAAAAAFGVGIPGQEGGDANFVDVLNSRPLREDLLNTPFTFHAKGWRFGPEAMQKETLYAYLDAKNMDLGVKKLGDVFSASRDLKSKIITITAETKSPELSQQIVRRATSLLEEFAQSKSRTRGGEKAVFAEARLKDARKEMDQAETEFLHFLEVNRNYQVSGDPSVRLQGGRLEMELKLRQQLVTTLALNREQSLMEEKNDMPILNILEPGNLPIEKSRPSRATLVVLSMMLMGVGSWAWLNRDWLRARLLLNESSSLIPNDEETA